MQQHKPCQKREALSENNDPKELAGEQGRSDAIERLCVRICNGCAMDKQDLAAVVLEMQTGYSEYIHFQFEECLDLCDFSPSTRVGESIIAPASPQRLREEIEFALPQSLQKGVELTG